MAVLAAVIVVADVAVFMVVDVLGVVPILMLMLLWLDRP